VSRNRPGPRGAAAGLALAAVGVIYSRITGRRPESESESPAPGPQPREVGEPSAQGDDIPSEAVERARSELAEELARRAGRSDD
jgi:hypothetical protein